MESPGFFICVRHWLFIVCLLSICHVARGGFERSCSRDRRQFRRGICGRHLSTLLSTVCRMYNKRGSVEPRSDLSSSSYGDRRVLSHEYNSYSHQKRAYHDEPDLPTNVQDRGIFLSKPDALSILKRGTSIRGTITCECCVHQCTFREISQYCSVLKSSAKVKPRKQQAKPGRKRPRGSRRNRNRNPRGKRSYIFPDSSFDASQDDMDLFQKAIIGQSLLQKSPMYWENMASDNDEDVVEYDDSVEHIQYGN